MQVWWMAEDKPEPQGAASSWFPPFQAPAGEENNLGGGGGRKQQWVPA